MKLNLMKLKALFFSIILIMSLIGCGTSSDTLSVEEHSDDAEVEELIVGNELEEDIPSIDTEEEVDHSPEEGEETDTQEVEEETTGSDTTEKEESSSKTTSTATEKSSESSDPSKSTSESTKKEPSKPKEEPKEEEKKEESTPPPPPETTVTLTVIGPKDVGTVIGESNVTIKDGDTVLDVLLKGAERSNIQVDFRGRGATAYVEGIHNIYEMDYGLKSGWVGKLNGADLTKSAGSTAVKDGDRVQFLYTED